MCMSKPSSTQPSTHQNTPPHTHPPIKEALELARCFLLADFIRLVLFHTANPLILHLLDHQAVGGALNRKHTAITQAGIANPSVWL